MSNKKDDCTKAVGGKAPPEVIDLMSDSSDTDDDSIIEDSHRSSGAVRSTGASKPRVAAAATAAAAANTNTLPSKQDKAEKSPDLRQHSQLRRSHEGTFQNAVPDNSLSADQRKSSSDPSSITPHCQVSEPSIQPMGNQSSSSKPAPDDRNKRRHRRMSKAKKKDSYQSRDFSSSNQQRRRRGSEGAPVACHAPVPPKAQFELPPNTLVVDLCQSSSCSSEDDSNTTGSNSDTPEFVRILKKGDSATNAIVVFDSEDDEDIDNLPPPTHQAILNRAREVQQLQHRLVPAIQLPYDSSDDDMAMIHEHDQLMSILKYASASSSCSTHATTRRKALASPPVPAAEESPFPAADDDDDEEEVVEQQSPTLPRIQPRPRIPASLPPEGKSTRVLKRKPSRFQTLSDQNDRKSQEKSILKNKSPKAHALTPVKRHMSDQARSFVREVKTTMQTTTARCGSMNDRMDRASSRNRKHPKKESHSKKEEPPLEKKQASKTGCSDNVVGQIPEGTTAKDPGTQMVPKNGPPPLPRPLPLSENATAVPSENAKAAPGSNKSSSIRDTDTKALDLLEDATVVAEIGVTPSLDDMSDTKSGGTACLGDLSMDDESSVESSWSGESGGTVGLDHYDGDEEDEYDQFLPSSEEVLADTMEQVHSQLCSPSKTKIGKMWEEETLESSSLLAAYETCMLASDSSQCVVSDSDDEPAKPKNGMTTPPFIEVVDCFTRDSVNDLGLPVKDFAAYDNQCALLYFFRLEVEQSAIPGADLGAFITFCGAKKLKDDASFEAAATWQCCKNIFINKHPNNHNKNAKTRQVEFPYGYSANLTVTGENLFGKDKVDVLPPEYAVQEQHSCGNGCIDFLKSKVEADYMPQAQFPLSGKKQSISLGRYGPFQRQDRKIDQHYAIKNFIFDQGPAEYAFGVEEELFNRVQVIDITSDVTGLPHDIARSNIPMYVNEVGHSSLEQNVLNLVDRDRASVVLYYFAPQCPMPAGQKVELLTTYYDTYEKIRQQKGYGLKNLKGKALSCDESRETKFEHDFEEREMTEKVIHNCRAPERLSISEITELLEHLYENTWIPLAEAEQTSQLTCRQLVAMRRIEWVCKAFNVRIDEYEASVSFDANATSCKYPYASSFAYCRDLIGRMKWINVGRILSVTHNCLDPDGRNIRNALIEEMSLEILYGLRDKLPMAYSKSFWCSISLNLIDTLCEAVCVDLLAKENDKVESRKRILKEKLFTAAAAAKEGVKLAVFDPSLRGSLEFESGLHPFLGYKTKHPIYLAASVKETLILGDCTSSSFFLDNSNLPKALLAATAEKLAFYEAMIADDIEPLVSDFCAPLEVDGKFLMFEQSDFAVNEASLRKLGATPRSIGSGFAKSAQINETWYIIWQIFLPVHAVASKYLNENEYSMEILCKVLDIELALAKFAINRGVREVKDLDIKRFLMTKTWKDLPSRLTSKRNARPRGGADSETLRSNIKLKKKKVLPHPGSSSSDIGQNPKAMSRVMDTSEVTRSLSTEHKNLSEARATTGHAESKVPRSSAKVVYEGPPTRPLNMEGGWPPGWCERTYQRMSGASKGHFDSYWFSPKLQKKLRSISSVKNFLELLKEYGGDEDLAYRKLPTK